MSAFSAPPMLNYEGKERHLGIEIEYTGLSLQQAAEHISQLFGGEIQIQTDAVCRVVGSSLGDFTLELDAIPIQKLAEESGKLRQKEKMTMLEDMNLQLNQMMSQMSEKIVPFEIVCPPIRLSQMPELEKLRDVLREAGARGTKDSFYAAFGLHLNPEVPSLEPASQLAHLQSYILLAPWLKQLHEIDISRYATNFIDPFPVQYAQLILQADYQPNQEELIRDYHVHNPTRNRALDMLPLFCYIDETLVRSLYGEQEKIHKRPSYHYRIPNCELSDPDWSFRIEWERWLWVEKLAQSETMRQELIEKWCEHQQSMLSFEGQWIAQVKQFLDAA